jgi:hypothetical protein
MSITAPPTPVSVGLASATAARLLAAGLRRGPLPKKHCEARNRWRRNLRAAAAQEAAYLEAEAARLTREAVRLREWVAREGGKGARDA